MKKNLSFFIFGIFFLFNCKTQEETVISEQNQQVIEKAIYFEITTKNENKNYVEDYINNFVWDEIYSDLTKKAEDMARVEGVDNFIEIGNWTMDVLLKIFRFGLKINKASSNIDYDEQNNLFIGTANFYIKLSSFNNAITEISPSLTANEQKGLMYLKTVLDTFSQNIKSPKIKKEENTN